MRKKLSRALINWLILTAYCISILILSSASTPKLVPSVDYSDKILHFGAFVVLSILFWRAFSTLHPDLKKRTLVGLTFVSSTAFGALIEINQSFLAYRNAEMADLGADMVGTLLGILVCLYFVNKKNPSNN